MNDTSSPLRATKATDAGSAPIFQTIVATIADRGWPGSTTPATVVCDEECRFSRDASKSGRSAGELGRPEALAGIFRYVLEADLFDRAQIRSGRCGSAGSRAGNRHHGGEEDQQTEIRSCDWFF